MSSAFSAFASLPSNTHFTCWFFFHFRRIFSNKVVPSCRLFCVGIFVLVGVILIDAVPAYAGWLDPTACFSISPSKSRYNYGETITFDAACSHDNDNANGDIIGYYWYVDGNSVGNGNSVFSEQFYPSTSDAPRTYQIKLIVEDGELTYDTYIKYVTVYRDPHAHVTVSPSKSTYYAGELITFDGGSSHDSDESGAYISSYYWLIDWGWGQDGGPGEEIHRRFYMPDGAGPEIIPVYLQVRDDEGRNDGHWVYLDLHPIPPPALSSPSNGATSLSLGPTLGWAAVDGAEEYGLQVAVNSSFSSGSLVVNTSVSNDLHDLASGTLDYSTTYYWRVRSSHTGTHGTAYSDWSSSRSFTTYSEPPQLSVSHSSMPFGDVEIGYVVQETMQISNIGGGTINGFVSVNTDDDFTHSGAGNFNLSTGETHTLTVNFVPKNVGSNSAIILVDTDTGHSNLYATGNGITASEPPELSLNPYVVDFGDVVPGSSYNKTFAITNTGEGYLTGTVSNLYGDSEFVLSGGSSFSLGANASKTWTVTYAPQTFGSHAAYYDIDTNVADWYGNPITGSAVEPDAAPTARLKWSQPSHSELLMEDDGSSDNDENGYEIRYYRWGGGAPGYETYFTGWVTSSSYSVSLPPCYSEANYLLLLSVKDDEGSTDVTDTYVNISNPLPGVVSLDSPSDGATGQPLSLTLDWSGGGSCMEWYTAVEISTDFTNWTIAGEYITNSSQSLSGLDYSTTYYWRVRSGNVYGNGPWSSVYSFTTEADPNGGGGGTDPPSDEPVTYYYLKDRLGSVRAVIDETGTVKETRDYYPFGLRMPGRSMTSATPTKEDFTGHEFDFDPYTMTGTRLHYAGARYYMPAFGRWMSVDPLLNELGPKALLEKDVRYLSMSPYNYVHNNPTYYIDPDGKQVAAHAKQAYNRTLGQLRGLWNYTAGRPAAAAEDLANAGVQAKNYAVEHRGVVDQYSNMTDLATLTFGTLTLGSAAFGFAPGVAAGLPLTTASAGLSTLSESVGFGLSLLDPNATDTEQILRFYSVILSATGGQGAKLVLRKYIMEELAKAGMTLEARKQLIGPLLDQVDPAKGLTEDMIGDQLPNSTGNGTGWCPPSESSCN